MQIIQVDPDSPDISIIQHAATIIRNGGLIAFPTETVYGLGVDGTASDAIRRIYQAKGRPASKPVLVLIDDLVWLDQLTLDISDRAYSLMDSFWPGPLTLVLSKGDSIPYIATGGLDTIAVRIPNHRVPLAIVDELGLPITGTSANLSGQPDLMTIEAVETKLGNQLDGVLKCGPSPLGIPSTVVDVSKNEVTILREGAITADQIFACV